MNLVLAGFAGTGKTTIVQHFINGLDRPAICCAPTGKAADVLRRKLNNSEVSTIHRALYKPLPPPSLARLNELLALVEQKPEDVTLKNLLAEERFRLDKKRVRFTKRDKEYQLIQPGDLVVVDEASMVTRQMYDDFLLTRAKVLFVGDPGQLPPVQDKGFFDVHPSDACLTQIHRQALDSPILRLSLRIRNGESIAPFRDGACAKAPKTSISFDEWLSYDQIITGANASRRRVNRYFRKIKGYDRIWPMRGEPLICLKNAEEYTFINGVEATALEDFAYNDAMECAVGAIEYDGHSIEPRCFYPYPFRANYEEGLREESWYNRAAMVDVLEFDFAYAITVHKAQGSEWDRVIIADDQMMNGRSDFRKKWLYTAVTRAKEELLWLY